MWQISLFGIIIAVILYFIGLTLDDIHNDLVNLQHLVIQFNHEYREVNNKPKRGRKPKDNSELQK